MGAEGPREEIAEKKVIGFEEWTGLGTYRLVDLFFVASGLHRASLRVELHSDASLWSQQQDKQRSE